MLCVWWCASALRDVRQAGGGGTGGLNSLVWREQREPQHDTGPLAGSSPSGVGRSSVSVPAVQEWCSSSSSDRLARSEELPGLSWRCLPLEHEVLPLPGPKPWSQPCVPASGGTGSEEMLAAPQSLSSRIPGLCRNSSYRC